MVNIIIHNIRILRFYYHITVKYSKYYCSHILFIFKQNDKILTLKQHKIVTVR